MDATSKGSTSAQIPDGERKSGMPLSVLTPAPVSTRHGCRSRTRAARPATDLAAILGLSSWKASRSRRTSASASPRPTPRASRITRRSSSGSKWLASRTSLPTQAATRRSATEASRRTHDRGLRPLPPGGVLRRDAEDMDALYGRARGRFRYEYSIEREGELVADGYSRHATVDRETYRPTRVPARLAEAVARAELPEG